MAGEYGRVGCKTAKRWPAPPEDMTPDDLLAPLRTLPDGAGLVGYAAALARRAQR